MLLMGRGGARVKSVQFGSAQIGSSGNERSVTVTISPVALASTYVTVHVYSVGGTGSATVSRCSVAGYLVDETTLKLERVSSDPFKAFIHWEVIELEGAEVQYVTGNIYQADTKSLTIAAVNPEATFGVVSAATNSPSDTLTQYILHRPWVEIVNPTTVSVRLAVSLSSVITYHAYIVEVK